MPSRPRRLVAAASVLLLVSAAAVVVLEGAATASTTPTMATTAQTPTTARAAAAPAAAPADAPPAPSVPTSSPVAADPLPTVQINGVVWRQAIAGNVVFAGGEFTNARPAGAAPGVNTVPRSNLLAYDIRTGVLIASFSPVVNGKVNDLAVTPDGTKLVVGGLFTTVDGAVRNRVAVFDLSGTDTSTPTVTLSSLAPSLNGSVYGVTATNGAIFVGGSFSTAGTSARPRFASFSIDSGAVLPAVIPVDNQSVRSLVVSPDGSQVVLAGNFTSVGGKDHPGFGMYRADAATGEGRSLAVNDEVRDAGPNSAILRVATDGTYFYGVGYKFNAGDLGNSEGTFQGAWSDGSLVTLEDCHGDTYDVAPMGDLVYKASHKHYCGNSGGFPQTQPQTRWDATAWTKTVEGSPNLVDAYGYLDHPGTPHPGLVPFFPQVDVGTYTGQSQAVWTVTASPDYVLYGGEFPRADGVGQQGLVRYATRAIAPNKEGPRTTDGGTFAVTARSLESGKVRVTWPTLWDRDDATLTYDLYRDGSLIRSSNATAFQWDGFQMKYDDTDLATGNVASYEVHVSDPSGNTVVSTPVTVTVAGTDSVGTYGSRVLADGASKYWRLDEADSSVTDLGGLDATTAGSGVTRGSAGALLNTDDTASTFDGTTNGRIASSKLVTTTSNMSEELWFRTTSPSGKLAGFGDVRTGSSALYDRHLYMNGGKVFFGVTTTANKIISSPKTYADGAWHQVVATLGSHGMSLYLDGALVASNPDVTYGRPYPAYFRIGGDSTWSGSENFTGQLDEVSLYPSELSAAQVDDHWVASGRTTIPPNASPTASFSTTTTDLTASFDASASADTDGTIATYAWDWGDGSPAGTDQLTTHAYAKAGTYPVTLTVTDDKGATGSSTSLVNVPAAPPSDVAPVATFTSSTSDLTASFDASLSSDSDGSVAGYTWSFGDGTFGSGATVTHDYAQAGTYTVTLTVTDDQGATGATTSDVAVTDPPPPPTNQPPTASFTASTADRTVSVDASASKDPDGTIEAYSWSWGDSTPAGSGKTATHTYAADGSYTVTLTVSDDAETSTSTTRTVTVANPATTTVLARDTFNRTASGGWGSATVGGAWTLGAAKTQYSVAPGLGKIAIPTSGRPTADLRSVSSKDTDTTVEFSVDKRVNATYVGINGRQVGADSYNSRVRIAADGSVQLYLLQDGTAVGNAYTVPGLVITPGARYQLRFKVSGTSPTTLSAKAWASSGPEPAAWQLSAQATQSPIAALQAPGYVGLYTSIPSGGPLNTTVYSYLVTTSGPATQNASPTASFTASTANRTVSVDASASKDPDGTIATYSWSWGDTTAAGSGRTATHTYAADGSYPVTLTVTDNSGGTAVTSKQVAVTTSTPTTLASDAFGRSVANGWGSASSGGAWTVGATKSQYSVAPGLGRITAPASGRSTADLRSVSSSSTDTTVEFSVDKRIEAAYVGINGRQVGSDSYNARIRVAANGTVQLFTLQDSTAVASLTVPGLVLAPGTHYRLRFQARGTSPTTLSAKVWRASDPEPGWQLSSQVTKSPIAGLQRAGYVGVYTSTSGGGPLVTTFYSYVVTDAR